MKGVRFYAAKKAVVDEAFEKALFAAQEQILTDCNYYARKDTGTMIETSRTLGVQNVGNTETSHVNGTTLRLVWDTPYAHSVYYFGVPCTGIGHNPNASLLWAEKAARQWHDTWRKILEKGMRESL